MTCTPTSSPTRRAAAAPASVAAFTEPTSPRMMAVTRPASTFCQLTRTTSAVLSMASAASTIPTRPRVSIMPSASPTSALSFAKCGSFCFAIVVCTCVRLKTDQRCASLPPLPGAQAGDMRDVMTRVPRVHLSVAIERLQLRILRMNERSRELLLAEDLVDGNPARVQCRQQVQRNPNRQAHVAKLGERLFVVRLDCGVLLGQRELDSGEAVHVAVGHVMDHLADSPSIGTIRRVELRVSQPGDRVTHPGRQRRDLLDRLAPDGRPAGRGWRKPADGIPQILHAGHHADLVHREHAELAAVQCPAPAFARRASARRTQFTRQT